MAIRILVGAGKEKNLKQLSNFLSNNGFIVAGEVDDGYDYLRKVHSLYPDLCIIDGYMKGLSSLEITEVIVYEKIAPILVMLNEFEIQNYAQLNQESSFVPIIKPINKDMLLNTIQILIKTNRSIKKLEKEVVTLKETKNEQELIDKAKKLLM